MLRDIALRVEYLSKESVDLNIFGFVRKLSQIQEV